MISQTGALESGGGRILPSYEGEVTQLTEVDVSDPGAMRVVRTERIRGRHVSSRLTGDTARVVIWTRPRAVVEPQFRTQLRGWLPRRVLRRAAGGRPAHPLRRPLSPGVPAGPALGHRRPHRADGRHGQGPARRGLGRRDGRRPDRLRVPEGAVRRHTDLDRGRPARRRAHAAPQVRRLGPERDELPRERPAWTARS